MRRKRICQLGSPLDNFYSCEFWRGAADEAARLGHDLVYFAGGLQRNYLGGIAAECGLNESRSTLLYQTVDPALFDGVLVWGAQWQHDVSPGEIRALLDRFAGRPVVSVGWSCPGIYGVLYDNYTGMRKLAAHLIRGHGHRRIAFLKSEVACAQREADERFRAFSDEMQAAGLAVDPALVVFGSEIDTRCRECLQTHSIALDWGKHALDVLLDDRGLVPGRDFTAVMARDDWGALSAIEELSSRGFAVPQDVAVTGFDDLLPGRCSDPPLSTVEQSFYAQSAQAVRLLDEIFAGKAVPEECHMEALNPVIRESCGCPNRFLAPAPAPEGGARGAKPLFRKVPEKLAAALARPPTRPEDLQKLSAMVEETTRAIRDSGEDPMGLAETLGAGSFPALPEPEQKRIRDVRLFVGDLAQRYQMAERVRQQRLQTEKDAANRDTFRTYDLDLVLKAVAAVLPSIGAAECSIVIYSDSGNPLDRGRLLFSASAAKRSASKRGVAEEFPVCSILPDAFNRSGRGPCSLYLEQLFFANHRLGYLVLERGDSDGRSYSSLAMNLASSLEGAFLVQSLNEKKAELEKAYAEILALSEHDALTGVFNRRFFEREILNEKHRMERYTSRETPVFSLLFIDLDNFKYYNDAFGHQVGDAALKVFAEMLSGCTRVNDVVARYGGDEFIVLLPETGVPGAKNLAERILRDMGRTNHLHEQIARLCGKEIQVPDERLLSCSIGIACSGMDHNTDAVIQFADLALYWAKSSGRNRYCVYGEKQDGIWRS